MNVTDVINVTSVRGHPLTPTLTQRTTNNEERTTPTLPDSNE